ncbi:ankyrin repeat-containing domain protein [Trichophaea hybrida]|nr:ankyrin repeat-containing domain protein [Trichophaea hybrida]
MEERSLEIRRGRRLIHPNAQTWAEIASGSFGRPWQLFLWWLYSHARHTPGRVLFRAVRLICYIAAIVGISWAAIKLRRAQKQLIEEPTPPSHGDAVHLPTTTSAPQRRIQRAFRITELPSFCQREDIPKFFQDAEPQTIKAISLGPSPYSDDTKHATISFDDIPASLETLGDYKIRTAAIQGKYVQAKVDSGFLDLTSLNQPTEPIAMDVIAVTGLAGHAFGSWKERQGNNMWLRDMLCYDIPNIRILTYGFDSTLINSASISSIENFATTFLQSLIRSRDSVDEAQRPIVFIAHSLGGLIVKEALVQASHGSVQSPMHNDVFKSTYGAIFFGVPNRGLRVDELRYMVRGQPIQTLINELAPGASYLGRLHRDFVREFRDMKAEFISCYETKLTNSVEEQDGSWKRVGKLVQMVDRDSATDSVPYEATHEQYPIDKNHSEMVKFTRSDSIYRIILYHLEYFTHTSRDITRRRFVEEAESLMRLDNGLGRRGKDLQRSLNIVAWNGNKAAVKLLLRNAEVNWKDRQGRTALYWAALGNQAATSKLLLERGANGNIALYQAACDGKIAVMELLLKSGVKVNPKNEEEVNALHGAASNRMPAAVQFLIQSKANWHIVLLTAARKGEEADIDLLLKCGADLNEKDRDGEFLLSTAAKNADEGAVKLFIKKGANIYAKNSTQDTALSYAVRRDNVVLCELLLGDSYAHVNMRNKDGDTPLLISASEGNVAVTDFLLRRGAQISMIGPNVNSALLNAAKSGNAVAVGLLLNVGGDKDVKDIDGRSPLDVAVRHGHEMVIKQLMKLGAVKKAGGLGETPLCVAARSGDEVEVKRLVEMGADKEAKDQEGDTILSVAAFSGHQKVVKLLMETGADKEARSNQGRTAMTNAAIKGHTVVVKMLMEMGADKEANDNNGDNPLILAAKNGHVTVVKLLVEMGADKEARNNLGWSPLYAAAAKGHEAVAKLLVEMGADKEARNIHGASPLHAAAFKGHETVVKLLVEMGADKEARNNLGRSPMTRAAGNGHAAVVKMLVETGTDKEAKDNSGDNPLLLAAWNNHEAVAKLLVEMGADKEARNDSGVYPLNAAASEGHEAVVKLLVEMGADKEARNNLGRSPMASAATNGHAAVVKLLLEMGADKNYKNNDGETAMDLAVSKSHEAVVRLLEQ